MSNGQCKLKGIGNKFLKTLTNGLWYIDGNHQTLAARGYGEKCNKLCPRGPFKTFKVTGRSFQGHSKDIECIKCSRNSMF